MREIFGNEFSPEEAYRTASLLRGGGQGLAVARNTTEELVKLCKASKAILADTRKVIAADALDAKSFGANAKLRTSADRSVKQHALIHQGNGDSTVYLNDRMHELLDEAFSIQSGLQQGGTRSREEHDEGMGRIREIMSRLGSAVGLEDTP